MGDIERIIFIYSAGLALVGIFDWYKRIKEVREIRLNKTAILILSFLPVLASLIILYILRNQASFDVVDNFIYIVFYLSIGLVWIRLGLVLIFLFFDLSWIDDVLNNNNKAALFAISGAYIGTALIYSGANIGDGPGWWCVLFAGGLGLTAWILLGILIDKVTQVFERITVRRDINCGIRTGFYFLASGVILGRASAGDWTSFSMTILEFSAGWPVLILALLTIIIERYYMKVSRSQEDEHNYLFNSVFLGVLYIILAVFSVVIQPFPENPSYGSGLKPY
ncbi:MAG: hypothetical protein GX022_03590 [Clostridiaceae bacterium]|nr:hypothetical protein [Clostridiaceae bacterium]